MVRMMRGMKRAKHGIRHGSIAVDAAVNGLMLIALVLFLYPVYQIFVISISDPSAVYASRGVMLWPKGVHWEAYQVVLQNKNLIAGIRNALVYMGVGVGVQYLVTILAAYPLSLKGLPGKKAIWVYFMVTMYFNGGIVPMFLLISRLGMINTLWALTLPGAVNISNLIIMRTQFLTVPDSLKDAARIDGANNLTLLFRVMLPLSAATSAVLVLFGVVAYWNMWYEPMIYMTKRSLYPIQSVLREILIDGASVAYAGRGRAQVKLTRTANGSTVQLLIKYAMIVVTTAPMLLIYPFVQKHFTKGVMLGSIKE